MESVSSSDPSAKMQRSLLFGFEPERMHRSTNVHFRRQALLMKVIVDFQNHHKSYISSFSDLPHTSIHFVVSAVIRLSSLLDSLH